MSSTQSRFDEAGAEGLRLPAHGTTVIAEDLRVTAVDCSSLPELRDLDPEEAYLGWTITVPGSVAEEAVRECFDFVAPDAVIEIERAATEAPAAEIAPQEIDGEPAAVAAAPVAVAAPARETHERSAEPAAQTIRVDLTKLDMLLNLVGGPFQRGDRPADPRARAGSATPTPPSPAVSWKPRALRSDMPTLAATRRARSSSCLSKAKRTARSSPSMFRSRRRRPSSPAASSNCSESWGAMPAEGAASL